MPNDTLYSDGSFFPKEKCCGSSVVLGQGQAAIFRPPGYPFGYKAELYAFALACRLAKQNETIYTDSKAVLTAIQGQNIRVVLRRIVQVARDEIAQKSLRCEHVQAHVGFVANEQADLLAKKASRFLPPQKMQIPRNAGDVCFEGELQLPPHKVWARHRVPHFSHEGVHWWSWAPLHRSLRWAKWFFGVKCAKGYSDPRSFWKDARSHPLCPHCCGHHNQSIHGSIAYCTSLSNPLLSAWLAAWRQHGRLVWRWRGCAVPHDLQLTGKLLCPSTLVQVLINSLGYRKARQAVGIFYGAVLDLFAKVLPEWTAEERNAFKLRLDPFSSAGWDVPRSCLP